jgi:two-component system NtrC family sensor kinase
MANGTTGGSPAVASRDATLRDEVQRQLEQRPRITLRLRIALVFAICMASIAGITVGSLFLLSRVRTKLQFLEAADACAFEIQEARRYEKNYFLYGTDLHDALDHAYRAHRLLEANTQDVERVVGQEATRRWTGSLEAYERLLEGLARAAATEDAQASASVRDETETRLRRFGAEILTDASNMITKERRAMDELLRMGSLVAVVFLAGMLLLAVALADHLARHVILPIGRFVKYVGRIADGDVSPIRPARRYRDEFSALAVAINRMLDELTSRQEQLLQSRKMAALGTLTSGVAHELNNPLNNINLTVETLLDECEERGDDRTKGLLDDINTQVQRASATVRNLLDFTRRDQPVFAAVSIQAVLDASLKLVRNELALGGVETDLDIPEDIPPVNGNPRNLEQVFLNLFLNAQQAMPQGGRLTVAARLEGALVRVSVRDTGTGIPEEIRDKVFEPFFTTKDAGEGTGLGLSVSYSIIEKHHGRLEVDSREGQGATFHVLLPIMARSG